MYVEWGMVAGLQGSWVSRGLAILLLVQGVANSV